MTSIDKALDDYAVALGVKPKPEPGPSIGERLIVLAALPLSFALWLYVEVTLWGWFVVPLGLPPLTMAHALGLSTTIGLFRYRRSDWKMKTLGEALGYLFGPPLVGLLLGWLALWWMP